ncbi:MAG: trigger factor, partial [Oscillospiraceae bacterium]|nr:trigger factor [Oscillospiraceae bacterium]
MNVKNVERENGKAKITVEIGAVEFENALNKVYAKVKKNIAIPGFRKGKAPRKIVESMYGAQVFYEDAIEEIFPEVYATAVIDEKINAVGRPAISDMQIPEEGGVVLVVETDLYPEVTLGQYKGLEVPKAEATVTDEEVEADIDRMVKQNARISTVDRAAQNGDTVTLDFDGYVDGEQFQGGKAEGHNLVLGSGQFIPGFEDQLVGMTAGESKDVVVTFPEEYGAKELAGKEATFKCTVHEVKESILPEKDDEFAKDVSEFDTLDELRADLRATILKQKSEGIENAFENACIAKAVENMTVEVPASMVEEQLDRHIENLDLQLKQNGMSIDTYVQMLGGDMAKMRESFRPMAEVSVKNELLIAKVAEEEKIEITEEELDAEFKALAEQYSMEETKVRELMPVENLRA